MDGKTGRLFIEFGVVLSFAVIFSSIVALTLTPMLCSKLIKPQIKKNYEPILITKFRKFERKPLIVVKKLYLFTSFRGKSCTSNKCS